MRNKKLKEQLTKIIKPMTQELYSYGELSPTELNKKINMVAEKPEPRLIMVICSDTTCKFNVKGCTKLPTITIKDMGTAPVCASYE